MKKIRFTSIVISVVMLIGLLAGCNRTYTYNSSLIEHEFFNEKSYNYDGLKAEADLIAKIKILDELTNENSTVKYYKSGHAESFTSDRQAEVIKIYKNTDGGEINGKITVTENVGIGDNGKCYMTPKDKEPLKKDGEYLVFLKMKSGGRYALLSQEKAKYDLNANNNGNEVTFKFLLEYELTEENADVPIILKLPEARGVIDFVSYNPNYNIQTSFGEITVCQAKTQNNNYHFELWKEGTFGGSVMLTNMR